MTNGWALSGITTYQTGFPIRITSLADNELMYSFDFELPGQPAQIGSVPYAETSIERELFLRSQQFYRKCYR